MLQQFFHQSFGLSRATKAWDLAPLSRLSETNPKDGENPVNQEQATSTSPNNPQLIRGISFKVATLKVSTKGQFRERRIVLPYGQDRFSIERVQKRLNCRGLPVGGEKMSADGLKVLIGGWNSKKEAVYSCGRIRFRAMGWEC